MENEELHINPDETPLDIENQDEFFDTLREAFSLLDKWENLIVPFTRDLEGTYQELFEHQYPGIKPYRQLWHINWVKEAMDFLASQMCNQLIHFFDTLAAGEDYKGSLAERYEESKARYFNKYVAKRRFFRGKREAFSAETLASIDARYEQDYQEDLIGMAELWKLREEFVDAVLETLSTYYEEELAALSPDESIYLRFLCYMFYEEYFEESKCLRDYLIKRNMVEFPGVGFYQYKADEWNRVRGK